VFVCCVLSRRSLCDELITRPTDRGASCVITKPRRERGGHSPRWAAEPEKIIIIFYFSCALAYRLQIFCIITPLYKTPWWWPSRGWNV
jgi:hypothetical protein